MICRSTLWKRLKPLFRIIINEQRKIRIITLLYLYMHNIHTFLMWIWLLMTIWFQFCLFLQMKFVTLLFASCLCSLSIYGSAKNEHTTSRDFRCITLFCFLWMRPCLSVEKNWPSCRPIDLWTIFRNAVIGVGDYICSSPKKFQSNSWR